MIPAMPRTARIVIPGLAHHVTQRGNNRQDVFFVHDDRAAYLTFLARECQRYRVAILGYCLMTNHTHLLLMPTTAESLARAVGRTHWLYAQYLNRMHRRSGHVWQNRFYSAPIDDENVLLGLRYIERNPLRARMARNAAKYLWSSAAVHCDGRAATASAARIDPRAFLDLRWWREASRGVNWTEELVEPIEDRELSRIRRATHTGRPLASDHWLAKLESKLGRRLRARPVGRPKGSTKKRAKHTKPSATRK